MGRKGAGNADEQTTIRVRNALTMPISSTDSYQISSAARINATDVTVI